MASGGCQVTHLKGPLSLFFWLPLILQHAQMCWVCESLQTNPSQSLSTESSQQLANTLLFLHRRCATDLPFSVNETDLSSYNKEREKLPGLDFTSQPERLCWVCQRGIVRINTLPVRADMLEMRLTPSCFTLTKAKVSFALSGEEKKIQYWNDRVENKVWFQEKRLNAE